MDRGLCFFSRTEANLAGTEAGWTEESSPARVQGCVGLVRLCGAN